MEEGTGIVDDESGRVVGWGSGLGEWAVKGRGTNWVYWGGEGKLGRREGQK